MLTGEVYGGAGSRETGGGPPSIDEMDMLPFVVLDGRVREFKEGNSRPAGKDVGGPTETDGARGGGGP